MIWIQFCLNLKINLMKLKHLCGTSTTPKLKWVLIFSHWRTSLMTEVNTLQLNLTAIVNIKTFNDQIFQILFFCFIILQFIFENSEFAIVFVNLFNIEMNLKWWTILNVDLFSIVVMLWLNEWTNERTNMMHAHSHFLIET